MHIIYTFDDGYIVALRYQSALVFLHNLFFASPPMYSLIEVSKTDKTLGEVVQVGQCV